MKETKKVIKIRCPCCNVAELELGTAGTLARERRGGVQHPFFKPFGDAALFLPCKLQKQPERSCQRLRPRYKPVPGFVARNSLGSWSERVEGLG